MKRTLSKPDLAIKIILAYNVNQNVSYVGKAATFRLNLRAFHENRDTHINIFLPLIRSNVPKAYPNICAIQLMENITEAVIN